MKIIFNKEDHSYTDEKGIQYPSVTGIISSVGLSNQYFKNGNYYAKRGEAVHLACQYFDEGDLGSFDENIGDYVLAWENFRNDVGGEITAIEKVVFNQNLHYAGTIDRILKIDDYYVVLDIKTGQQYKWHALQLAGYAMCLDYPKDTKIVRWGVYLKDKTYNVVEYRDTSDFGVFESAVRIYNWLSKQKPKKG
jgi:hypothetical protein